MKLGTIVVVAISKPDFYLPQANETGSSNAMELEGCKRCFSYLQQWGVKIQVFISDRHSSISKWLATTQKSTTHYYDIWHIAKSISKKILKASKEKGCNILQEWNKAIKNHLYWCAISSRPGFGEMIVAKWKSLIRHISNIHKSS